MITSLFGVLLFPSVRSLVREAGHACEIAAIMLDYNPLYFLCQYAYSDISAEKIYNGEKYIPMPHSSHSCRLRHAVKRLHVVALLSVAATFVLCVVTPPAHAASSWNPTLLVNTESFSTIDEGDSTTNIELRFGPTLMEKILYSRSLSRFEFSRSVHVGGDLTATGSLSIKGTMSGSSLRVDHNADIWGNLSASGTLRVDGAATFGSTITLNGVTYTFPSSDGTASGKVLATDGAGNLSWTSVTVTGSGNVVSLSPEYQDAVYVGSGSTNNVGQLSGAYDETSRENYYHWISSKGTLQTYWIIVRVRVPTNFAAWNAHTPVKLRYRTGDASNAVNHVSLRMLDTAGNPVALSGAEDLANTSWTTATVTGPEAAGTFAADQYVTLIVKLATTVDGSADAGFLQLNWHTTAP